MFRYLSIGLGKLRIPVMIYITVIMAMVFLAMNRFFIIPDKYTFYALTSNNYVAYQTWQTKKQHTRLVNPPVNNENKDVV